MKSKNKIIQISCDGGAATGKSTGAKLISKKYGLKYLSSGLLYRYASYLIIKNRPKKIYTFINKRFKKIKIHKLNKINLHTPEISELSALIAKQKKIRNILKDFQVNFINSNSKVCIEGRDIGTVIMPKADVKFFFTCNLNTAAKRRFNELKRKNRNIKFSEVKKAMRIRDKLDRSRKNSPLIKPKNAVIVPTDKLNINDMVNKMSKTIEKKIKEKYGSWNNSSGTI